MTHEQHDEGPGASSRGPITVTGAGALRGDVHTTTLTVNGSATVNGHVSATSVTINGTARIDRSVQAYSMQVNGDSTVGEGAGVGSLQVAGRFSIAGGLNAREVNSRGELAVGGDLDTERITAEGGLQVGGVLRAHQLDLRMYRPCSIRAIQGGTLSAAPGQGWTSFSLFGDKRLTVDTIEGETVRLEGTTARLVRGTRVTLGDGCRIETIEYTESLEQRPGAQVVRATKLESP